jgi:hypothetical protein
VKNAVVGAALGDLGSAVTAAAAAGGFSRPDSHLTRTQVTVDERGWKDLDKELNATATRVQRIVADSAKRLSKAGQDGEQSATVVTMLFGNGDGGGEAKSATANGSSSKAKPKSKRSRARA